MINILISSPLKWGWDLDRDFLLGLDIFLKTNVLFDHHYILLPVSNKISNSTHFVYTLAQTNVRPVKAQLFATINNAQTHGIY